MVLENTATEFLPTARISIHEIKNQSEYFTSLPFLQRIIDFIPDVILIFNEQRQVVLANKSLSGLCELDDIEPIYGLRTGEVLNCVHSDETEGGCGTTEFCKICGSAKAIQSSEGGAADVQECRITRKRGLGVLDLRIKSSPIEIQGEWFTFFVITDIGHEKRRRSLERIFFHDILNIAGNIKGLFDIIRMEHEEIAGEYSERLESNIDVMVGEIKAQKDLAAAENNDLAVRPEAMDSMDFLREITELYKFHKVARQRHLRIAPDAERISFTSDRALLSRVIGNMVKNALEASCQGDIVSIGCRQKDGRIEFRVHNPGVMPREVQLQIFQRSFSTKSSDRGLGAYSMKLLSERYLRGSISFSSSPEKGTVFMAGYPLTISSGEMN